MSIPAFPQNTKIVLGAGQEIHQGFMGGMTLRDYFAAKAMQVLMDEANDIAKTKLWIAITAYSMADAMLKERK
jgi:hypothetical protein